jgi:mannose-6-phosphate isomerase-like protein (cupin superfamily)
MHANVFVFSQLLARSPERYLEFVRVPSFTVGLYVLETGATDHQKPHAEDEVYYVTSGRAKMKIGSKQSSESFEVGSGTIIFVPARVHHVFYEITERLELLVFFGPKQSDRRAGLPGNDDSAQSSK